MSKIILYEYDKQNREYVIDELEIRGYVFVTVSIELTQRLKELKNSNGIVIDISSLFRDDDKSLNWAYVTEIIIDGLDSEGVDFCLIIDRRYTYNFKELLFHKIEKIENLEKSFGLKIPTYKNVVDLKEEEFVSLINSVNEELVGNTKFKLRLEKELRKYRVFNTLGYQPIFSALICGNSGIGKTELARTIHRNLCPTEHFIKINFGNYSDQNALSSLIGSPRGYVGSSKGELSDKLANSRARVILIDEFEKSNKQVQNFFLQLLEDGVFTDSLGRDYDLDKYIIVFTANLPKEKIPQKLSPELLSRFNLKYSFSNLSLAEKSEYVVKRVSRIMKDIKEKLNVDIDKSIIEEICDIDVGKYENMRDINSEIMKKISDKIYSLIY